MSVDRVRALDAEFRRGKLDVVMDRALEWGSPYRTFWFHIAEWP